MPPFGALKTGFRPLDPSAEMPACAQMTVGSTRIDPTPSAAAPVASGARRAQKRNVVGCPV